jgi:glutathione S-transferase
MLGGEPRLDELPGILDKIAPSLALLDRLIDASGFALGRFTIADVAAAPILFRTTKTGLSVDAYPNLARWRDVLLARPAFAAADPVT